LFIKFKLKVEEARSRGIDTTTTFLKEYNSYRDELRKPYLPEGKMIDSLVLLTYNRLKEEVRASHLLIGVKPEATPADTLEAYNRILELKKRAVGGEDFGALAMAYSEDPSAKMNKGDLGYFTAMQMVYPFETAAYTAEVGSTVGPIRTRFGYHLLKIADRQPARGEVEVSHIMIRTQSEQDQLRARNKIFDIFDQLRGGVTWDELCKQHSEDLSTKENGGRLRPFGVGAMSAVPEFEKVAFSLQKPGEYSDPFQTAYGWHIVRLENKIPLPPLHDLEANLKARVARDERAQISRLAASNKLRSDFGFTENEEIKRKVMALADSTLISGKWRKPSWRNASKEYLFSLNQRKVSVQDFFQYAERNQKPTSLAPVPYLNQVYEAFVDATLNEAFEKRIIKNNPDFGMLLTEYYEGILLFDIMEKEVWNKASEDSIGQHQYYLKNQQKYQAGDRIEAIIYSSSSNENILTVKSALEQGDSVSLLSAVQSRKIREEKGVFQKEDRPPLSKIDWKPGIHSVQNSGMYYLVLVKNLVPPGQMSFVEARPALISDYQNYLEDRWIEQLKKKYPVKVNEKNKQYVFEKLVK
jgi:peptidyl-prolyl cis-trans isomerase SurA